MSDSKWDIEFENWWMKEPLSGGRVTAGNVWHAWQAGGAYQGKASKMHFDQAMKNGQAASLYKAELDSANKVIEQQKAALKHAASSMASLCVEDVDEDDESRGWTLQKWSEQYPLLFGPIYSAINQSEATK